MIDPDAITALAVFPAVAATAWAGAFAWVKWLAHQRQLSSPRGSAPAVADADRLARLETAIDAVTLEVERLGEGQRYTLRVLDERLPRALPASDRSREPGRVITPH